MSVSEEMDWQQGTDDALMAVYTATYTGTDPDDTNDSRRPHGRWRATDGSKFDLIDAGALTFKAKPDFEAPTDANKNNVYEVTVRAADSDGNRGEMAVKVTVMNEDEDGVVTLSRTLIRVGVPVTASLSDPDGSISGLTWQWSIDGANGEVVDDGPPATNAIEGRQFGHLHHRLRAGRWRQTDAQGRPTPTGMEPMMSPRWEWLALCRSCGHPEQGSGVRWTRTPRPKVCRTNRQQEKSEENTKALAGSMTSERTRLRLPTTRMTTWAVW